jgi:hypothetical protein
MLLDDRQSDHHRGAGRTVSLCSVGGLTTTEVGLIASLYSMPDNLINGHKWILLARSMTPVRGHAYKRH